MSSLYGKFVKETLGWSILEDDNSFVTYEVLQVGTIKSLKIMEMFIDVPFRGRDKSKHLLEILEATARSSSCNQISAQVSMTSSEFIKQRTEHICRLFGMQKVYEDQIMIVFSRSL